VGISQHRAQALDLNSGLGIGERLASSPVVSDDDGFCSDSSREPPKLDRVETPNPKTLGTKWTGRRRERGGEERTGVGTGDWGLRTGE
jgi:hypothetical protein